MQHSGSGPASGWGFGGTFGKRRRVGRSSIVGKIT